MLIGCVGLWFFFPSLGFTFFPRTFHTALALKTSSVTGAHISPHWCFVQRGKESHTYQDRVFLAFLTHFLLAICLQENVFRAEAFCVAGYIVHSVGIFMKGVSIINLLVPELDRWDEISWDESDSDSLDPLQLLFLRWYGNGNNKFELGACEWKTVPGWFYLQLYSITAPAFPKYKENTCSFQHNLYWFPEPHKHKHFYASITTYTSAMQGL